MTPVGLAGRVAGAAAALGAGVVISLAAAAPASADDSGARDSGSRSAATDHSAAGRSAAAPASSAAAPARRGSAPPERSANPEHAKPAAVISVPQVVRPAAAVPTSAPKSVAPAVTAPNPAIPAPAAVVDAAPPPAAASQASPAPQSLFFDPRGRRITVLKGVHFVLPQSWAFFVKQVAGSGTFTTDSVYDLKNVDQYDWNKFTGIAFSPLQHDRNSVMVGWRYNLTTQQFEIAPFYNVNKERILPNEQTEVISVPPGETFTYKVDYTGVTISYGDKTVFKPYPPGLTPNIWTATRVSGWFGGNEVAPRTLTYYLKFR
jgi:hypothetical protein